MFLVNAQKFPIWWNMMECHVHQRSWWDREKLLLYRENLRTNLTGGSFPKSILKHQQVEPEFLQAPAFAMGVDLQRRELRHEFNGPGEERWDYTVFGSVKWSNTVLLWTKIMWSAHAWRTCSSNDVEKDDRCFFFTTKIGWIDSRAKFNPPI